MTPKLQKLLAEGVLPLSYALKLATVPRDRQSDALNVCYRPLFRDEGYRRDQLEPLANLTDWLRDNVRRDLHGQDTQMLLPDLAALVTATELKRHRAILKVSELTIHTDRSDRDIILAKSWKRAETSAERCKHARPAIVVLGPNQDKILNVCIAKKECEKHWLPLRTAASNATHAETSEDDAEASDTSASTHEPPERQKREQERTRWEEELRPRALRLFAERTTEIKWSWPLLRHLLSELDIADTDADVETSELADLVGALSKVPVKRYPQILAVAFALQRSWSRESLVEYAEQLGVSMNLNDLSTESAPTEPAVTEAPRRTGRKKSTQAA